MIHSHHFSSSLIQRPRTFSIIGFIFLILSTSIKDVVGAITSCDCQSSPDDFWYGWDCHACTCPPASAYKNNNSSSNNNNTSPATPPFIVNDQCLNDNCPAGQYVCCTEDQTYPDLSSANTDNSCGRLVYYPIVVACNGWNCISYPGCHHNHKVEVSGCGCGCHKSSLGGWEIALIIVAAILGFFAVLVIIWYIYFSCYKNNDDNNNNNRNRNNSNNSNNSSRRNSNNTSNSVQMSRFNSNRNISNSNNSNHSIPDPVPGVPVWINTNISERMMQAIQNNNNNNNVPQIAFPSHPNSNNNNDIGNNINNNDNGDNIMNNSNNRSILRNSPLGSGIPNRIERIVSNWDVSQVCSFVASLGLPSSLLFHNNRITGKDLLVLSPAHLQENLGLSEQDCDVLRQGLITIIET